MIDKHIDWATGYGIDFFLINWPGRGGYQDEALKIFSDSYLVRRGDIKFAMLYESIWRLRDSNPGWNLPDSYNVETLKRDFEYILTEYGNNPSYLKINRRPFLYIYEGKGFFGDIDMITKIKEKFGLFLVSDHAHPLADPSTVFRGSVWGDVANKFDAIMPGGGVYVPEKVAEWESYKREGFQKWSIFCQNHGIIFIPDVTVGISYKHCPWGEKDWPPVIRSTEKFRERILTALLFVDKNIPILVISEFNNFFEDAYIEPSIIDSFNYLNVLKAVLMD